MLVELLGLVVLATSVTALVAPRLLSRVPLDRRLFAVTAFAGALVSAGAPIGFGLVSTHRFDGAFGAGGVAALVGLRLLRAPEAPFREGVLGFLQRRWAGFVLGAVLSGWVENLLGISVTFGAPAAIACAVAAAWLLGAPRTRNDGGVAADPASRR